MSDAVESEVITKRCGRDSGRLRAEEACPPGACASCEATFGVQVVPRACATNNTG